MEFREFSEGLRAFGWGLKEFREFREFREGLRAFRWGLKEFKEFREFKERLARIWMGGKRNLENLGNLGRACAPLERTLPLNLPNLLKFLNFPNLPNSPPTHLHTLIFR